MKVVAYTRAEIGSGASRRLRAAGMAPGIVYGGNSEPVNIKLDHNALFYALKREAFHSSILDLEIDGKEEKVLLRDFQVHAYKPVVLHVDFQRVDANQKITVKVPLHFINEETAPAVKAGGVVSHLLNEVEVVCLPKDLPEAITVDIAKMEVGQTLHLTDLKTPAGVELAELAKGADHDQAVVTIAAPKGGSEETEAEASAE